MCSKTTWTCKVAIMQPCNKTWSQAVGVSQCAGTGTYGRTTTCGKTDPHGQSFCCIKSMLPLISISMDHQQGRRALYTRSKKAGKTAHLPECCSGKGDLCCCRECLPSRSIGGGCLDVHPIDDLCPPGQTSRLRG